MDDELSGSDEDDDTPVDLKVVRATSPSADPAAAAEAALAKAYFTSHTNISNAASAATFSTLPNCTLSRQLLLSLGSLNLTVPTPIQRECIPVAMLGKDIVASSRTGSGKTVAFWVGVIERLLHRDRRNPTTRVVVMTPTRELAVQVHGVGVALARFTDVQFCLCVGKLFPTNPASTIEADTTCYPRRTLAQDPGGRAQAPTRRRRLDPGTSHRPRPQHALLQHGRSGGPCARRG